MQQEGIQMNKCQIDLLPTLKPGQGVHGSKPNQMLEAREPVAVIHTDWLSREESRVKMGGNGWNGARGVRGSDLSQCPSHVCD